jgi:hypothetical protein
LLDLGKTPRDRLTLSARALVEDGESLGYDQGYKCRIRKPTWWSVPSVFVPDAFLLRQIYDGPRIVLNDANATCTDTIHRVRCNPGTDASWLAAASMNSLTWAFTEIHGRSYGGGVHELEPNEADGLPFPKFSGPLPLEDLDDIARRKPSEVVLAEVDRLVLVPAGLTKKDIESLRDIWRRLSGRRLARRRR